MVYDMLYDMIYSLTAIGLTPGGSSTVHIYTQTIHRITQYNTIPRTEHTQQWIHKHNKKNMKEAVKLHMVCISSNNDRHSVPKTFNQLHYTSLHYTCRHFTSTNLNFIHLHFTTWRNNRDILILCAVYVMENIALYCIANYMKLEIKLNDQPTDRLTHHRQTGRYTDRPLSTNQLQVRYRRYKTRPIIPPRRNSDKLI
jgi:hypothetical protein